MYESGFYDQFANQDENLNREGYLPQELRPLCYDLHNEESCNNQEEQDFQGLSNLRLEHQEDIPSPYEQVASNHDKELANIFPDLFQNFITDTPIQEPSSLSLESYLDAPIVNKYSDEEYEVEISEELLFTQISSSSSFQQRDDKECVKAVIVSCYKYAAQKFNTDFFGFGISHKYIIMEKEIVSYNHDEFKLGEGEQKDSDQLLSLHFYQTKEEGIRYEEEDDDLKGPEQQGITHPSQLEVEQSTVNIVITESSQQQHFIKLEKQHKKVFLVGFYDPIDYYLELMRSIDIKIFLSDDSWFFHPSKLHCCIQGFIYFLGQDQG